VVRRQHGNANRIGFKKALNRMAAGSVCDRQPPSRSLTAPRLAQKLQPFFKTLLHPCSGPPSCACPWAVSRKEHSRQVTACPELDNKLLVIVAKLLTGTACPLLAHAAPLPPFARLCFGRGAFFLRSRPNAWPSSSPSVFACPLRELIWVTVRAGRAGLFADGPPFGDGRKLADFTWGKWVTAEWT